MIFSPGQDTGTESHNNNATVPYLRNKLTCHVLSDVTYIFEMDLYTCTMALYPRSFVLEYFLPGKLQIRRRAYNWWGEGGVIKATFYSISHES